MADKKKQVMTYDSVLVFEFLLKKLARCLAKTKQTLIKLLYFVNIHSAQLTNY